MLWELRTAHLEDLEEWLRRQDSSLQPPTRCRPRREPTAMGVQLLSHTASASLNPSLPSSSPASLSNSSSTVMPAQNTYPHNNLKRQADAPIIKTRGSGHGDLHNLYKVKGEWQHRCLTPQHLAPEFTFFATKPARSRDNTGSPNPTQRNSQASSVPCQAISTPLGSA